MTEARLKDEVDLILNEVLDAYILWQKKKGEAPPNFFTQDTWEAYCEGRIAGYEHVMGLFGKILSPN